VVSEEDRTRLLTEARAEVEAGADANTVLTRLWDTGMGHMYWILTVRQLYGWDLSKILDHLHALPPRNAPDVQQRSTATTMAQTDHDSTD
jgi:hypothetical protein